MLKVIENKMPYSVEDVLAVTERVNNQKRNYLLLNKLQGKYIPVDPRLAMAMFEQLAGAVRRTSKKIIVVGFAETATAIGAKVASCIAQYNQNVLYLPTTREIYNQAAIAEFKEEHSHAVEQILYGNKKDFEEADLILFVEDEVTTGNTICNCVKALNMLFKNKKYAVASILNCMTDEELLRFEQNNIDSYCLIKAERGEFKSRLSMKSFMRSSLTVPNPRKGVNITEYDAAILKGLPIIEDFNQYCKSMLLIGTEECMYPAILLGDQFLEAHPKAKVKVTSTTRVQTFVRDPLISRNCVASLYGNRNTYLYNLEPVDCSVIVTDGNGNTREICTLLKDNYDCKRVLVLKLKEEMDEDVD